MSSIKVTYRKVEKEINGEKKNIGEFALNFGGIQVIIKPVFKNDYEILNKARFDGVIETIKE